jgi:rRNA maturation RNase YbeY
VISVDTARRQAEERAAPLAREIDRLLIHGVLHLLGYDHERSPAEARRMQRRERALARRLEA